jgi:uncharacterized protein YxjI
METFGRKGTATRYQMRQKLIAFGDDFYIENEAGQKVFEVDGKCCMYAIRSNSRICG